MNTQKFEIIAKAMSLDRFYNFTDGQTLTGTTTATVYFNTKKQKRTFLKKATNNYNHYNCEETKNKSMENMNSSLVVDIELR